MKYALAFILMFLPALLYAASTHHATLVAASSQYAEDTTISAFPTGNYARTWEAWVKTTGTGTMFEVGTDGGANQQWAIRIEANIIVVQTNGSNIRWTATDVDDGNWHHLAVTHNGAGNINDTNTKAYLDGAALTFASGVAGTPNTTTTRVRIGAGDTPVGTFFTGDMDEVRYWNSVRTQSEIQDNDCIEITTPNNNLAAYYKLNNDWVDASSTPNSLTAVNSPTFNTTVPACLATAATDLVIPTTTINNGSLHIDNGSFIIQ